MKIYSKEDLNNLQSDAKETVLKAEKTFIVFGEGLEQKAILLFDVLEGNDFFVDTEEEEEVGEVKEEPEEEPKKEVKKRGRKAKK